MVFSGAKLLAKGGMDAPPGMPPPELCSGCRSKASALQIGACRVDIVLYGWDGWHGEMDLGTRVIELRAGGVGGSNG
jgi:hypothetical protein